jgi:hypothetical protein
MRQRRWLELIKDYDLEVHYHLGKAIVVADALSRKSQCNCVMMDSHINTLCDELNKMKIEVISSGTLSHISIEPTLQDHIIMAQLSEKGVQIIKENLHQKAKKYNVFAKLGRVYYGLKTNWWFLKIKISRIKSWMRLISPNSPCIREAPRCTMI